MRFRPFWYDILTGKKKGERNNYIRITPWNGIPQAEMEVWQGVAHGHEWCLGAKGSCASAGAQSLCPACRDPLGMDPVTLLSLGAFMDMVWARLTRLWLTSSPKIKSAPVSRFPAAQNPRTAVPEQVTSDRPPEETGGCLLCREPTFKAEKSSHCLWPQWGFRIMLTGKLNSSELLK